jgi:pimeloyl-ACP methyl ester carboxylesterase
MRDREAEHREKRQLIARFDDEYDKTGFCVYTDNINDLKTPSTFDLPVITLSGMPSFTYEWSKLESAVGARWINFLAPGLDGFDERNRTPSVRLDSFALEAALLLKRLLNKLNIKKAVIFAHSFAIYLLSGIINFMPERVAAVGMFGTGQMTSENHLITSKQQFLKMLGSDIN